MAVIEIPISSNGAHFEQENEVFTKTFIFEFEWVERESTWLLHIFDDSHNPLALGLKLQPMWPIYSHHIGFRTIKFMLVATKPCQSLCRNNLKDNFILVAREAV